MAEFSGFILTTKGRELLARAVAGETLTFTKISFGDGLYEGDKKEIEELAGLKNIFSINQIKRTGPGQVLLKTIITNRNVETGYHIREIGIYAVCGNGNEVLYAYNTATEADYLPPFNENNLIELEYQNYVVIDQAETVTAVIDPSAAYLTKEEAAEVYVPQTQVATKTVRGITSGLDIRRTEILNILGLDYGGEFGTNLTSIQADKVYFYKEPNSERTTPYVALASASGVFTTPDIGIFKSLSNRDNLLYKKLTLAHTTLNNIHIVNAFLFGNLLFVNGFVTNAVWFNSLPVGSQISNIGTMIPEIMNCGVEHTTVTGTNLDLRVDFTLTKALANLTVNEAEHFTIIAGLTKGTIR